MPAQVGALSDEEIRNVVAYAKTLAPAARPIAGRAQFLPAGAHQEGVPEDEIVWKSRVSEQDGDNVWRNVIEIEKRFGKRSMGVLEVIHEDDGEDSEITKVEAAPRPCCTGTSRKLDSFGRVDLRDSDDSEESDEIIPYLAYGSD